MPSRFIRSMLFVPGSRPERIEKAAQSAADAVCLDLEDSVAPEEKAASRANVVRALQQLDFGARVRIVRDQCARHAVHVSRPRRRHRRRRRSPRPGDAAEGRVAERRRLRGHLLSQIETSRGFPARIGIEAQIETAKGFLYAREIASATPRLDALIFGPGDYAASMHMPAAGIGEFDAWDEIYPGHRWHAVMHTVVAAARANGLRCMDGPYSAFKDAAGLERAGKIARAMGFDGKQCIHPAQLAGRQRRVRSLRRRGGAC